MERIRREKNRAEEEAIIRRMQKELEDALARQWKLAQEQLALAVKQAEDRLRALLELEFLEEKQRFAQELLAKKEVRSGSGSHSRSLFSPLQAEYAEREAKALQKLRDELNKEHAQDIEAINERHANEVTELNNK